MHTTKPEGLYVCLYGLMAERGRSACIDLKAWLGSAVRPLTRTTVNAMQRIMSVYITWRGAIFWLQLVAVIDDNGLGPSYHCCSPSCRHTCTYVVVWCGVFMRVKVVDRYTPCLKKTVPTYFYSASA